MPTSTEITDIVQDKMLDNIRVGQQAVVDCVGSWADTMVMFSKLPQLASADATRKPSQVFESTFGFTQKVMASYWDFASRVFEAALPATKAAQTATANVANAQTANAQAAKEHAAKAASAKS